MELKDLVPPVALCAEIPEGKFSDSALIWCYDGDFWSIQDRNAVMPYIPEDTHPAPTLQEILREMANPNQFRMITVEEETPNDFTVVVQFHNYWRVLQYDRNPATAALKLWLGVNKPDMPDRTDRKEEECEK